MATLVKFLGLTGNVKFLAWCTLLKVAKKLQKVSKNRQNTNKIQKNSYIPECIGSASISDSDAAAWLLDLAIPPWLPATDEPKVSQDLRPDFTPDVISAKSSTS